MDKIFDLNKVEVNTYRMIFLSDGLLDIYLGLTLIPFIVWIYSGWTGSGFLNGAVFLLAFPLFLLMKKRVVIPRVGMIKPGPVRRKKTKLLALATILAVLLTIGMVLFTIFAGEEANRLVAGIPIVFWALGLAIVLAGVVVAWLADWPRVILYGLLAAITIPLDPVYFLRTGRIPLTVIPMLVMVGTGLFLLIRLLRRYPEPHRAELV
jgi:peptidoglycan/LPS O-acetylase OafA/YrhL